MVKIDNQLIRAMTARALLMADLYKWGGLHNYYIKYLKIAERLVMWRCQRLKRKIK